MMWGCCKNDVLFSCVIAFPKLSRLVTCTGDMSMRDVVVESPLVKLFVRLFECSLLFRHVVVPGFCHVNITSKQTSLVLCVLRPGERNGCDSVAG